MNLHELLGIIAGVLAFSACPIYVRSILKGDTRPSRVTWWVLALLNGLLAASYFASGARDTIWIPVSYTVAFTIVALFSVRFGEGSWTRWDTVLLGGALAGLLAWWILQSSEIALYIFTCIDLLGLAPTAYKSYARPWTESHVAWLIATAASLLNLFAIETWTFAIALYPVYVFITNAMVATFIVIPRKEHVGSIS